MVQICYKAHLMAYENFKKSLLWASKECMRDMGERGQRD